MSRFIMFTVYDSKAEVYDKPFCLLTKGECVRGFMDALNAPNSTLSKYPADFNLFEIGWYDQKTGTVEMHKSKINLGNGLEFKSRENDQR